MAGHQTKMGVKDRPLHRSGSVHSFKDRRSAVIEHFAEAVGVLPGNQVALGGKRHNRPQWQRWCIFNVLFRRLP